MNTAKKQQKKHKKTNSRLYLDFDVIGSRHAPYGAKNSMQYGLDYWVYIELMYCSGVVLAAHEEKCVLMLFFCCGREAKCHEKPQ